jgi:hypothetical protein
MLSNMPPRKFNSKDLEPYFKRADTDKSGTHGPDSAGHCVWPRVAFTNSVWPWAVFLLPAPFASHEPTCRIPELTGPRGRNAGTLSRTEFLALYLSGRARPRSSLARTASYGARAWPRRRTPQAHQASKQSNRQITGRGVVTRAACRLQTGTPPCALWSLQQARTESSVTHCSWRRPCWALLTRIETACSRCVSCGVAAKPPPGERCSCVGCSAVSAPQRHSCWTGSLHFMWAHVAAVGPLLPPVCAPLHRTVSHPHPYPCAGQGGQGAAHDLGLCSRTAYAHPSLCQGPFRECCGGLQWRGCGGCKGGAVVPARAQSEGTLGRGRAAARGPARGCGSTAGNGAMRRVGRGTAALVSVMGRRLPARGTQIEYRAILRTLGAEK